MEKGMVKPGDCPNANDVDQRGFYLPSGATLTEDQQNYIVQNLKSVLKFCITKNMGRSRTNEW